MEGPYQTDHPWPLISRDIHRKLRGLSKSSKPASTHAAQTHSNQPPDLPESAAGNPGVLNVRLWELADWQRRNVHNLFLLFTKDFTGPIFVPPMWWNHSQKSIAFAFAWSPIINWWYSNFPWMAIISQQISKWVQWTNEHMFFECSWQKIGNSIGASKSLPLGPVKN